MIFTSWAAIASSDAARTAPLAASKLRAPLLSPPLSATALQIAPTICNAVFLHSMRNIQYSCCDTLTVSASSVAFNTYSVRLNRTARASFEDWHSGGSGSLKDFAPVTPVIYLTAEIAGLSEKTNIHPNPGQPSKGRVAEPRRVGRGRRPLAELLF